MGFKLLESKYLKNIDTTAHLYQHEKTKARLLFFSNNDINKSFSITFKTIPYNDNGIFHILEHSVLCGSEKYPVKEPFVELMKGSFNTFINAMTFSDKTMYPVSSKNDEDLKILMDIYLDAVFNPQLLSNDKILKQEGWHYHLENKEDDLIYKGVVYNEMKGAYSSIDEIIDMHITESIFEDSPYKYSYGGKPKVIPSITQEEFIETYKYCYHPSNSYIFLYGDIKIEDYLTEIDKYLSKYDEKDYNNYKVNSQPKYKKEYHATYFNEEDKDKHYVVINHIIGKNNDIETLYSIDLIDELLLGNSNTEFRKYFIDNSICEDVYSYIQRDRVDVVYSIVFKHVKDDYIDDISKLYKEQITKIINNKFDKEQIQAVINKNNFIIKEEVNKVSSPKGVSYAVRALRNWLHDESPFDVFEYDKIISILENNLRNSKYEKILESKLLNNDSEVVLKLISTNSKKEEKDLKEYKNSLSENEIEKLILETKELLDWQNSQDKKEDLEKIKSVDAKKVNLKNPYVDTKFEKIGDVKFGHYETNTNGIVYSKYLFDITSFNEEELKYASLYSYLLFNINTKNKTELEVINEIDYNLGGISASINIYKDDISEDVNLKFVISAKNLDDKVNKLTDILIENTLYPSFENKKSIYNILLELKLNFESRFKNAGHSFVNRRISSYYSLPNKLSEYVSGYDFYIFVSNIVDNFEAEYINLEQNLTKISKLIFNQNNLLLNFVGSEDNYNEYKKHILNYVNKLNNNAVICNSSQIKFTPKYDNYSEGFYFDTMVQYVGIGLNINEYNGNLLVLRHILSLDYLWNNIRVKGGAYGAGLTLNKYGELGLWSYRDPNLDETLNVYYSISEFIKILDLDDKELNKYIIGTLNSFDQLLSPNERANISLTQHITNSNKGNYDRLVKEIKETTVNDLIKLAKYFDSIKEKSYSCIIGSKEIIHANKSKFNKIFEIK